MSQIDVDGLEFNYTEDSGADEVKILNFTLEIVPCVKMFLLSSVRIPK